jgi:hypothetical protein
MSVLFCIVVITHSFADMIIRNKSIQIAVTTSWTKDLRLQIDPESNLFLLNLPSPQPLYIEVLERDTRELFTFTVPLPSLSIRSLLPPQALCLRLHRRLKRNHRIPQLRVGVQQIDTIRGRLFGLDSKQVDRTRMWTAEIDGG